MCVTPAKLRTWRSRREGGKGLFRWHGLIETVSFVQHLQFLCMYIYYHSFYMWHYLWDAALTHLDYLLYEALAIPVYVHTLSFIHICDTFGVWYLFNENVSFIQHLQPLTCMCVCVWRGHVYGGGGRFAVWGTVAAYSQRGLTHVHVFIHSHMHTFCLAWAG